MATDRSAPAAFATGNNYGGVTAGQINIASEPDQKRQRIISWLSPLNFRQKQENVFADSCVDTGQWFLKSEQFRNWFNGRIKNLWCHGAPGSGKTVLSSIVVNHLLQSSSQDDQVGVAVVYCEWKQQNVQTVVNLLASIWSYLTAAKPLSQDVQDLYNHHTEFRTTVKPEEVLSILKKAIDGFKHIYVIIDALDELSEDIDRAKRLMESLSRLSPGKSKKVRILATSRSPKSILPESGSIQITATEYDIRRFVRDEIHQGLSDSNDLSNKVRDDENLQVMFVDAISKQVNGLFLLARFYIQSLRSKTSLRGLREGLNKLPPTINEQYQDTWLRIKEQNPDHRDLALRVITWLFYAFGTMEVQALRHALAVRDGDRAIDIESLEAEDLLLTCCHGLVAIERETNVIRLVHSTVQQYLNKNKQLLLPDGENSILQTCLTYLSFQEFRRGRCSIESLSASETNGVAQGREITRRCLLSDRLEKFPFLRYAATQWGYHASGKAQLIHEEAILAFLRDPMLLESAAQVQDSNLLYPWPRFDKLQNETIRKNLPLHVAGAFGLDHVVAVLLSITNEVDVNVTLGHHTVLDRALESGHVDLARVLLKMVASLEGKKRDNAIYSAVLDGHSGIVNLLLSLSQHEVIDSGAAYFATLFKDLNVINTMINDSSDKTKRKQLLDQFLFHAACQGRTSVIRLVTDLGADLEAKDSDGRTALFLAITYGTPEAVKLLLNSQASFATRDLSGTSLFRKAVSSQEMVTRLSQQLNPDFERFGFKAFLRSKLGELFSLRHFDDRASEILEMLLPYSEDVNEKISCGESLLHCVVYTSSTRARVLLEGCQGTIVIDSRDNEGRTPLHYAAVMMEADTMQLLLEHGADIAAKDHFDATTLHFSVNSLACTKIAICHGASAEARDNFGRTALHYAALMEDPNDEILDVLIKAGVESGAVDLQHMTADMYLERQYNGDALNRDAIDWICCMWCNTCDQSHLFPDAVSDNSSQYDKACRWQWEKIIDSYGPLGKNPYGPLDNPIHFEARYRRHWKDILEVCGLKVGEWWLGSVVSNSDEADFEFHGS